MRACDSLLYAVFVFFLFFVPISAWSYPSREITATGGPPFTLSITGELTGMVLIDDETMALAYGDVMSLIDLRRYTRATSQAPALTTADETDGNIMGIAHDDVDDRIVAAQVDGDILLFDLNHITDTPITFTVSSTAQLGPIAVDSAAAIAAVVDTKGKVLYQVNLNTRAVVNSATPTVGTSTTFSIERAFFLEDNLTFYFTTDAGAIFAMRSGSSSVTTIDVNTTTGIDLAGMAATSDGASLYVVDKTTPGLVKIDTATNTVQKRAADLPLAANASPTDIVIATVTNPVSGAATATPSYAFVSGTDGISVLNTANDEIFDLGNPDDTDIDDEPIPTSVQPKLLAASSSTDGYVYLGNATGSIGLLSANPWITISSLTYSTGGTSLTSDGTATLTFQSDRTGSYSVRVGGGVTANGTVVNLEGGSAATGTVDTAATNISLVIPYTNNSSVLSEGSNNLFVFVTDSSNNRGRIATTLTVDTPPPAVTIESVGYGNHKIYVNMTRLSQSDISAYNIYVATDATTVTTKTDIDLQVGQPSTGDTVTAEVSGLTNGTTYFVAVTATDNGGNTSATRTSTLADGSAASALPQVTSGPAGLAGETGCA
ncbi:MAG: hypothetical protein HY465_01805, partial [Deltaproteobacteria bacterium]|nr:hypothetical protein [Deltaproteobacteria bacterium]